MRVVSYYKAVIHLNTAQIPLDTKVQNFGIPSQVMSNHWNITCLRNKFVIGNLIYVTVQPVFGANIITCKEHLDLF